MFGKTTYSAWILREENGKYIRIGTGKVDSTAKSFAFKKRTFPIKNLNVAFSIKNSNILLFDFEGKTIDTHSNDIPISVDELDLLITHGIIQGLFSRVNKTLEKTEISSKLIGYILCLVAGGAIGYIINGQLNPQITKPVASLIINLLGVS